MGWISCWCIVFSSFSAYSTTWRTIIFTALFPVLRIGHSEVVAMGSPPSRRSLHIHPVSSVLIIEADRPVLHQKRHLCFFVISAFLLNSRCFVINNSIPILYDMSPDLPSYHKRSTHPDQYSCYNPDFSNVWSALCIITNESLFSSPCAEFLHKRIFCFGINWQIRNRFS